jgi:hypothetical protein
MRLNTLFYLSALGSLSSVDALEGESFGTLARRQIANAVGAVSNAVGVDTPEVVSRVTGVAPKMQKMKATRFTSLGAQKVKVRYGPYSIPGKDQGMIGKAMEGSGGMLWNSPDFIVQKPCTNCVLTWAKAGLELADGTSVNTNKGLWMHHMVAINKGHRADATCGSNMMSLPHVDVGTTAAKSERFFSSGNERTAFDVSNSNMKAGYYVKPTDKWGFIIDLMNTNSQRKSVYLTITFEYINGKPKGFDDIRPVWFDVDQCGVSDVRAKSSNSYVLNARTWHANFNGKVVGMAGHLHDGGINLVVSRNGAQVCDSKATYGGSPEYISPSMKMGGTLGIGGNDNKHISHMTSCYTTDKHSLGKVAPGQSWNLKAWYDYHKAPGMPTDSGKPSDVMAISIMYVAVPMT